MVMKSSNGCSPGAGSASKGRLIRGSFRFPAAGGCRRLCESGSPRKQAPRPRGDRLVFSLQTFRYGMIRKSVPVGGGLAATRHSIETEALSEASTESPSPASPLFLLLCSAERGKCVNVCGGAGANRPRRVPCDDYPWRSLSAIIATIFMNSS